MSKTIQINRFDLGMTNDPHESNSRYSTVIKNFDAHTFPHKLVPFRSSEAANTTPDTEKFVNFLFVGSDLDRLYGLGVVEGDSGTGKARILYKDTFGGTAWTEPSNGASGSGSRSQDFFIEYKDYIYGARASTHLWRHGDITSSVTWVDSWQSLTYENMAQGLIFSNDILHIPYDNKIATWDNSAFTSATLTLPTNRIITSLTEYGNYIAIATRPKNGIGNSIVYLWDASATSSSEVIDWGTGDLKVLEVIDGVLVGISIELADPPSLQSKIVFRSLSGSRAVKFNTLLSDVSQAPALDIAKQVVSNYLYFLLKITIDGTEQAGLWKLGKVSPELPFSLTFDRTTDNDTALISNGDLDGFFLKDDYVFMAFRSSGLYDITSTDDQANFTVTASYESLINPRMTEEDTLKEKQLMAVQVSFEALPTAGQVVFKYRVDSTTAWGSVAASFTEATDSAVQKELIIPATQGREYEFRIESTGGAVITGFKYKYEVIESQI